MKGKAFILFAGLLIAALPARASAQEGAEELVGRFLSGYLMAYDYLDLTRALDEIGFVSTDGEKDWFTHDRGGLRLQLRVAGDVTSDVSFDASVNFEFDAARATRDPRADLSDGVSVYFKEGYISYRNALGFIDLKVGRQYIFWGRFEWGGALDIISPWDYAHMSAEKENFRLAVDAFLITFNLGPVVLQGLAIPVFQPDKIPYRLPSAMGPIPVDERDPVLPDRSIENTELGANFTFPLGSDGEMTLYYFHGYDRTFSMFVESVLEEGQLLPTAIRFTPKYLSQHVAGLDAEYIAGPMMLIFEGAYFHTQDDDGENIFISNRRMSVAGGFEWDITSRVSLTATYNYTRLFQYDRQAEYDARVELGEPDPYVERTNQHEAVYRLRYYPIQELSLQLMQIFNIPDGDFMTLAFASWEITGGLKLYAGIVAFRGPEGTTFGRLEEQGRFFMELKYSF